MIDKKAIGERFFLCYTGMLKVDIARMFNVSQPTVTEWEKEGNVPWSKLKYLSDSQAVSWDWILEGTEPQESAKPAIIPESTSPTFDRAGINQRFLSLFKGMTQPEIAKHLNVTPGAVSGWNRNFSQVSWKRLMDAVETYGVRWDWLIDGLEPMNRQ